MKRMPLPVVTLALLLFLPLPALAVGLSDVIQALEEPFRAGSATPIRDFSADFFQESRLAALDRVQRGKGTVLVRFEPTNGGRAPMTLFRWDYDQPTEQEIVCDGKTLWVYLPDNRQVIMSDVSDIGMASADNPVTFLSGLGNLSRDFQISWGSPNRDSAGNWILELRPRRSTAMMRQLTLVVDRDAVSGGGGSVFPILSSTVVDPSDNATIIEFSNTRVNHGAPASQFRFIQPPGVEIVRPPKNVLNDW